MAVTARVGSPGITVGGPSDPPEEGGRKGGRKEGRGCEELRGVGEASVEKDDLIRSASIECTHLRLLSHRWLWRSQRPQHGSVWDCQSYWGMW